MLALKQEEKRKIVGCSVQLMVPTLAFHPNSVKKDICGWQAGARKIEERALAIIGSGPAEETGNKLKIIFTDKLPFAKCWKLLGTAGNRLSGCASVNKSGKSE